MNYKTFINTIPNDHLVKSKFPFLNNYLLNRYGRYDLLFEQEEFNEYFIGLILEYQNILLDIELALQEKNKDTYKVQNLGDKENVSRTGKSVLEGSNSLNYKGYEVLGEFEKKNENNTTNNTESVETTRSNMLNIISKLESNKQRNDWYLFEQEFVKLLITITAITF